MILTVYEDNDEIPKEVIEELYYIPEPKSFMIITSEEGIRLLNEAFKEYHDGKSL